MTINGSTPRTPGALSTSATRCSAAHTSPEHVSPPATVDLDLVHRLIAREEAAWRELLATYRPAIVRGATQGFAELQITPTEARLEEVGAEVVFTLLRNDCAALRSFQGRSTLATWLTVISRRVCRAMQLKHERIGSARAINTENFDWNAIPARHSSQELAEDLQCELRVLRNCVARLAAADQVILELCFMKGLSYQAMADALGIKTNTVGPKLTRARQRLRRLVVLEQQAAGSHPASPSDPRKNEHGSTQ